MRHLALAALALSLVACGTTNTTANPPPAQPSTAKYHSDTPDNSPASTPTRVAPADSSYAH